MSKVLLWQRAGYVSKDVWNEMEKIVDQEFLPSQEEINEKAEPVLAFEEETEEDHVNDERQQFHQERQQLYGSDAISKFGYVDFHLSQSIYRSKRKRFALKELGLEKKEYDHINTETIGADERNYQVFFENDHYVEEI